MSAVTDNPVTVTADPAGATGYDPGRHTVADVQAHVDADPASGPAVLAAERAGRNRSTLVGWLTAHEAVPA